MLEALKQLVCDLHQALSAYGLVQWTGGNISARDPQSGLVVIKPSGVRYEQLRPEHHVVVDVTGRVVEGALAPSSDTASHLYIYRQRADVHGAVHTHSPYATAFAAVGKPIPCCLTAIGDEFGGRIPCTGFALIGGEEIGRQVVQHVGTGRAVLLKQHGVFTIGPSAEAAVKTAVMVEDAARTVFFAMQLGRVEEIPPELVAALHKRYTQVYGQRERG